MIVIDPEFAALIPPAPPAEREALEASIVRDGCRDALVVWYPAERQGEDPILVDGHTRYEICSRRRVPFVYMHRDFADRAAVKAWILENQCARRNLSRFQRIMLLCQSGAARPAYASQADWTLAQRGIDAGRAADVVAGRLTQGMLRNRLAPPRKRGARAATDHAPTWTPGLGGVPLGPSGGLATEPPIQLAPGQELKRQTVHVSADGRLLDRYDLSQAAREPAEFAEVPEGHLVTKTTTRIDADGRIGMQYVTSKPEEIRQWNERLAAMARHVELYRGLADPVQGPAVVRTDLITLVPIGDPHIGMLSWLPETGDHFDTGIACRELKACIRELIADAPACERVILCNLGDAMHAQDDSARTPGHGNQLDVDGRFPKVLDALHVLLRGMTDIALTKFEKVSWRNLPGNHDPRVAAELAMWLAAVYEREPRVTVEPAYAAHQYDHFGCNLFGWHHGDRSKPADLPAIMASDHDGGGSGLWGLTSEHVWHVGHIHHKTVKETPSCIVETHNTMAARDAYHAGKYRAARRLQAITYHKDWGEHSRVTVSLARVRAALEAGYGA